MNPSQGKTLQLEVAAALHDLCQPLMALQVCLEIGGQSVDIEGLRQTVKQGLDETARIFDAIAAMRKILAGAQTTERPGSSFTDTAPWTKDPAK